MVLQAARDVAPHDPVRAREMAMFGAALAAFGGDSGVDIDPVTFAALQQAATARERSFAELIVGLDHVVAGRWAEAAAVLGAVMASAEVLDRDDQDLLPNLGIAAFHLGDNDAVYDFHGRLLVRARDTGAMVMVLYSLTRLAIADLATGQWTRAHARATEAIALGTETGQPALSSGPTAILLVLAAQRGTDDYQQHLTALEEVLDGETTGIMDLVQRDLAHWARGVAAADQPTAAFHQFGQMTHHVTKRMAASDRIETAVRAGQAEAARLWVADLEAFADATGRTWAAAAAAQGRALQAEGSEAEEWFERALALHAEPGGRLFDTARTHLAYGEHLRRARRRVDAREHLRSALTIFEDLQATPWVDRASNELRASGETARKRDAFAAETLTPQERQVATLVADGMSNKEVAAQLFLSPRTIDFHLRNVFAKTGVTSRVELARVAL
jgi:DNA-binding CsgD family transcriptional regulator